MTSTGRYLCLTWALSQTVTPCLDMKSLTGSARCRCSPPGRETATNGCQLSSKNWMFDNHSSFGKSCSYRSSWVWQMQQALSAASTYACSKLLMQHQLLLAMYDSRSLYAVRMFGFFAKSLFPSTDKLMCCTAFKLGINSHCKLCT